MFEIGDYALYRNEIVKILKYEKINGLDRYMITNNKGWYRISDLMEIGITEDFYWKLS